MLLLTAAAQNAQPDYVALAMVLGLFVIIAIMVIRKRMAEKSNQAEQMPAPAEKEEVAASKPAPAAPGSAGQVKLHGVEPKTAAMIMAIVADNMGKPLNELRFISIKEVK